MFGYVKIYKPELKFKEYELYRGIYCSLCKQLGKSYGLFSRFILNYDFTLLSVFLLATKEKETEFEKSHCSFCPAKKCLSCKKPDNTLEFCSAISIITAYHKVRDNYEDGSFTEKLKSFFLLPYFKSKYKKASECYPEISEEILNQMLKQKEIENKKTTSIDLAADASAKALGYIVSSQFVESQREIAYRFGYCLGRFIYLCDAFDDLEKDKKSGSYNVFLNDNLNINFNEIRNNYTYLLDVTADELAKSYELIKFNRFKSLLDNIIYYGLDMAINKVTRKEEKRCE